MTVMYVVFVVGVVVVAGVGLLVAATAPPRWRWLQDVLARFRRSRDAAVQELGQHVGAVVVLLAGSAAAVIISWPFGRFARRFKPSIDAPFLRWTKSHVSYHGNWHHVNSVLTDMGNRPEIKIIVLASAVILALLWVRRGWWVPILVVPISYVFEKFGQTLLGKVVDRPPVPQLTDFGTYPSGGCARLLVIYGVIWYMITLTFPTMSRRLRIAGFTVVAVLGFIEGYTRVYLIKHWGMDVVGGWLFGGLLMLACIAAASCFRPRAEGTRVASAAAQEATATAATPERY